MKRLNIGKGVGVVVGEGEGEGEVSGEGEAAVIMLYSPARYRELDSENSSFFPFCDASKQICIFHFSEMLRTLGHLTRLMFGSDQEMRGEIMSDSAKGHRNTKSDTENVARGSNSSGSRPLELELELELEPRGHWPTNGMSPTPFRKVDLTMWTQNRCIISEARPQNEI